MGRGGTGSHPTETIWTWGGARPLGRHSPQGDAAASHRSSQGIALILVLWVVLLLSVMAMGAAMNQRTELKLAANLLAAARAKAAATAAISHALYYLSLPADNPDAWPPDGVARPWDFDGMGVEIVVTDEGARVDLNRAPPQLLEGLIKAVGIDPDRVAQVRDAIVDWRDADNLRSPEGAEDDDYRRAGYPYGAKDQDFGSVSELLLVKGVTIDDYNRLSPYLTTQSGRSAVDVAYADAVVLRAIPGVTEDMVQGILQAREARVAQGVGMGIPQGVNPGFASAGTARVVRIQCEVSLPGAPAFRMTAIADRVAVGAGAFILGWAESSQGRIQ
jgi:general secretion pathway protein K